VIVYLGLDHQEIEVAVGFLLTTGVGAEQDDLGIGASRLCERNPRSVDQLARCHGDTVAEQAADNAIQWAAAA
jgi:hypothetical protein